MEIKNKSCNNVIKINKGEYIPIYSLYLFKQEIHFKIFAKMEYSRKLGFVGWKG